MDQPWGRRIAQSGADSTRSAAGDELVKKQRITDSGPPNGFRHSRDQLTIFPRLDYLKVSPWPGCCVKRAPGRVIIVVMIAITPTPEVAPALRSDVEQILLLEALLHDPHLPGRVLLSQSECNVRSAI